MTEASSGRHRGATRPSRSSLPPSVLPRLFSTRDNHDVRVSKIGLCPTDRRCVVVGAGLLGLSAAWALTRRGWSVDVLEAAGGIGHARSGSKGDARIFRLGYPEPHYVEMAVAGPARCWRELEAATRPTAPPRHRAGDASATSRRCRSHRRRAGGARSRGRAGLDPARGGTALSRVSPCGARALRAGLGRAGGRRVPARARARPVDFEVRHRRPRHVARQTTPTASPSRLRRRHAPSAADVVVDCAGPAALGAPRRPGAQLVGAPPSLPQVAYFEAAPSSAVDPTRLPGLHRVGRRHDLRPAGPRTGGPHAGTYKVSHHTPGPPLDAFDPRGPTPALDGDDPALLRTLTDAVAPAPARPRPRAGGHGALRLRQLGRHRLRARPGRPVVVGCGTSGHGFKFGPLLGELLADLAEGRAPAGRPEPLPPRPDRPPPDRPPMPHARIAPGRLRKTCPATSPCSAASTSPATAASP